MHKYKIVSAVDSKIVPGKLEVTIKYNNLFEQVILLPHEFYFAVQRSDCIVHNGRYGAPIAYSFGDDMYINMTLKDKYDAKHIINNLAGLRRLSLNKIRFCMALYTALGRVGGRPSFSPEKNLMQLFRIQNQQREK